MLCQLIKKYFTHRKVVVVAVAQGESYAGTGWVSADGYFGAGALRQSKTIQDFLGDDL